MNPKCSFIVSAYDRPDALACLLYSLKIQTHGDFECIVTDNAGYDVADVQRALVVRQMDERFRYELPQLRDCYETANWGAARASGDYLCFPSDDSFYCARFLELMLRNGKGADVIYCNCIWDGRGHGPGEECVHLVTEPKMGKIDKGGFLIKREVFLATGGYMGPFGMDRAADGWMIEGLVRSGATFQKVEMTAWAHS